MRTETFLTISIVWLLPVMVGIYFSLEIWKRTKNLNYRIAAVLRSLSIAGTFTPGYSAGLGFIPVPASFLLLFTPTDSSFLEQASVAIPPILTVWLILIPILLYYGKSVQNNIKT